MNKKKLFALLLPVIATALLSHVFLNDGRVTGEEKVLISIPANGKQVESTKEGQASQAYHLGSVANSAMPNVPAHGPAHSQCEGCASHQALQTSPPTGPDEELQSAVLRDVVLDSKQIGSIFAGGEGTKVSLPLPDGFQMEGVVEFGRQVNGEWVSITGKAESPHQGIFYFVKNKTSGTAGPISGIIRFDDAELAYMVESSDANAGVRLVKKSPDEVFCRGKMGMPLAKGSPLASSQTSPAAAPIISLQSRPGASGVIYLDFDGEEGPFPGWGNFDAKAPSVSDESVREVWEGVVEDYAPFNVNVTTDLSVYLAAPRTSRIQVVITPTVSAAPGSGGVAYLSSFNWDEDQKVCWAFYAVGKSSIEVISHEVGHTLGLLHDGRTSPREEYYQGQGSGAVGWAPIMGAGYYKQVTQWSKGEYRNPTRPNQDDLAVIEANNTVDYVVDDHANTSAGATTIPISAGFGAEKISIPGVISTTADVDCFLVKVGGGTMALSVAPPPKMANLDVMLQVYDLADNLLLTSNPDKFLTVNTSLRVREGTYLIRVSGVGRGDPLKDGYSDYGSLGQYTLTGTFPKPSFALDDHGNTFSSATSVNPPQAIAGILEQAGDIDTFTFTVPTSGTYLIESSGTTDVRASLFTSRSVVLATDDDSAGDRNFRMRIILVPGVYFVQVRAGIGSSTGNYAVRFAVETSDSPEIAVLGGTGTTILNKDQAPTVAKGNAFGDLAPNQVKSQPFTITNTGKRDLLLSGTPFVLITGTSAGVFTLDATPVSPVAPDGSTQFTISYRPTRVGTHVASVTIGNNDTDEAPYTFSIQGLCSVGSDDFATAVPLALPSDTIARIAEPSEQDVYRITLENTGYLVVSTVSQIDTIGQLYDGTGKFLQQDDDSGDGKNFRFARVALPGVYFIKVAGRTATTLGEYKLSIELEVQRPDIELVGLANTVIPNGSQVISTVIGTDFGTVDATAGYVNRSFNIKNTGAAVLNLTSTPPVTITGTGAEHFQLVMSPASPVGSGSLAPFILRFNPAFAGTHSATVTIASDDPDENPYTFNVLGLGTGLPDDHEGTFAGATPIAFGESVNAKLERVGDTDMFRLYVFQSGVVVIETAGTLDTSGALYNASQRLVARDDDGGVGPNFRISTGLSIGLYYIEIRGFGTSATGSYVLKTGVN